SLPIERVNRFTTNGIHQLPGWGDRHIGCLSCSQRRESGSFACIQIFRKECQYRWRNWAEVSVSAWFGDPLNLFGGSIYVVKPFCFFDGLLCAGEWKHVVLRRDNGIWLWRERFNPIGEIQSLCDEMRNRLFGILRTGRRRKQLIKGRDVARGGSGFHAVIERG